ncbi:MAG: capsule assembly Wzi family protein [Desulfuromonadales bacterium]|nr:capsule assembly Wzi family protein [Desulfuromonadales bacterium]
MSVLLLLALLCCPALSPAAPVSSLVPLDSWVYPALDKLAGLGLIQSSLRGDRPFTRLEAARQTREAADASAGAAPVVGEILKRLQTELADSLSVIEGEEDAGHQLKWLRQTKLSVICQGGQESVYPRTDAHQFALNTNNFGLRYGEGFNGQLLVQGDARLGSLLSVEYRPVIVTTPEDEAEIDLLEGRVATMLGPWEISFGRQALWWGQGSQGTLLLTNNAQPLDMVRITNPVPVCLPWIFEALGPFRFDAFWSRLEKGRVVPEPYFAGMRLNLKPFPWLEVGASRTTLFGGGGRPGVDVEQFITVLGGDNKFSHNDDSGNSLAGLDWRLKIPALAQAELYGEWAGEDQHDRWPTKNALLLGLYLPVIEPSQRLGLRFEIADFNYKGNGLGIGRVWYRHSVYQSGYTYEEQILAHPVGGDGQDYYAALDWIMNKDLRLAFSLNYEEREDSQPVSEEHYQSGLQLEWQTNPQTLLGVDLFYDRVDNVKFVNGAQENHLLLALGLTMTF